jgi:hypothetical protein
MKEEEELPVPLPLALPTGLSIVDIDYTSQINNVESQMSKYYISLIKYNYLINNLKIETSSNGVSAIISHSSPKYLSDL